MSLTKPIVSVCLLAVLAGAAFGAQVRDAATTRTTVIDGRYQIGVGDQLCIGFVPDLTPAARMIVPGDRLALAYHFGIAAPGQPYRIEPGDKLFLYFKYSPVIDRVYLYPNEDSYQPLSGPATVQPDGSLVLRAVDTPVMAADKTTSQIATLVMDAYRKSKTLEHPAVNISVEPQYEREKTLKAMFQSAAGDTSPFVRLTVAPDGMIGVPLIDEVSTIGKTAAAVSKELTEDYRKLGFRRVTISAWLDSPVDPRLETLRALEGGQGPLRLRVLSTGEISPPLLHTHTAVGKTPAQIARELTVRYTIAGYAGVRVTVWVEESASR